MAPEASAAEGEGEGGERAGSPAPFVVVVEDQAHLRLGHYPVLFAELADAFAGIGCPTVALTARGWSGGTATGAGVPIRRYGPVGRLLSAAGRLAAGVRRRRPRWRRVLDPMARALREVALVHESYRLVRHLDPDRPVLVVSVCHGLVPWVPAVLDAARPSPRGALRRRRVRWVLHAHYAAPARPRPALQRMLAWSQRRREDGGAMVIGVQDEGWVPGWRRAAAPLDAQHLPLTGLRAAPEVGRAEARRRLGLPADRALLLVVGAADPAKDISTVTTAVARLHAAHPDDGHLPWLVVAGGVADQLGSESSSTPVPSAGDPSWLVRRPGFHDATTRDLLPVAADVVVLSFVPGHRRASATLMDAVSTGTPVVASSDSQVAELVERHRLGEVFAAGDPDDLLGLLGRLVEHPLTVADDDLRRARASMSLEGIARHHLAATGCDGPWASSGGQGP